MYFGPSKNGTEAKPALGCPKCWFVLYFHDIATTPPEKRAQRLDELTEVIHHTVECVKQGKFDLNIDRHAKIETESN